MVVPGLLLGSSSLASTTLSTLSTLLLGMGELLGLVSVLLTKGVGGDCLLGGGEGLTEGEFDSLVDLGVTRGTVSSVSVALGVTEGCDASC
jgi:hypothetical protein